MMYVYRDWDLTYNASECRANQSGAAIRRHSVQAACDPVEDLAGRELNFISSPNMKEHCSKLAPVGQNTTDNVPDKNKTAG